MQLKRLPFTCSMVEIGQMKVGVFLRDGDFLKVSEKDQLSELRETLTWLPIISQRWFDEFHDGEREATLIATFQSRDAENLRNAFETEGFKCINKYAGFHGQGCETWIKTVRLQQ